MPSLKTAILQHPPYSSRALRPTAPKATPPPPLNSNTHVTRYRPSAAATGMSRQPVKARAEAQSKVPLVGLFKGFVADLLHVAGGKEP
jgi:hypothetical protein